MMRMMMAGVGCLAVLGVMLVTRVTSYVTLGTESADPSMHSGFLDEYVGEMERGVCHSYTCQHGGRCAMLRGKPVCLCKAGFIGTQCQDMRLELSCDGAGMRLQLLKSVLAELGVNATAVHTAGRNCTLQDTSELHASITLTRHNHTLCGTLVKVNGTHLIYSSELTSDVLPADSISRSSSVLVAFSCVYRYDRVVSLPFPLLTDASLVTFVVKEGVFNVTMTLHPTAQFLDPYDRPPVIPVTSRLFIQLQILGLALHEDFTLKLEECWATPTPDPASKIRHPIISKGLGGDTTLEWIRSDRTLSRFSVQMFHFVKFPEVFLHCRIWLCQPQVSRDCQRPSPGAGRPTREVGEQYRKIVSCGPIRVARSVVGGVRRPQSGLGLLVFPASFAAAAMLLLLSLVAIAKVLKKRVKKSPPHNPYPPPSCMNKT